MADNGWGTLGEVLGGGIDREKSYQEGRYRTAQTESAIMQARGRQLDNISAEAEQRNKEAVLTRAAESGDPAQLQLAEILTGGMNPEQFTGAQLDQQEAGFRSQLADPAATGEQRFLAGQGVQGKVLSPFETVGAGGYTDISADDPALMTTPLGESMIDENAATTALREVQAGDPDYQTVSGSSGPGGIKAPGGYMIDPNDPNKVIPIPGGPDDPKTEKPMGSREAVYFNRISGGAAQAAQTLSNLVNLPAGASTGVFGVGASPGANPLTATIDTLRNRMSDQEVQTYNTMLAGLDRNLAQIEGHGLATSDTFAASYGNLALREGDTVFTKLHKLAEIAQTVEQGLKPYLVSPRVPKEQKDFIAQLSADVRSTIPFNHNDVTALEGGAAPTLGDIIRQKGLAGAPGAAAPTPGAPAAGVSSDAEGWIEVSPGVRIREKL